MESSLILEPPANIMTVKKANIRNLIKRVELERIHLHKIQK